MASSTSITQAEQIIANHAFFFLDNCADWAEATVIFYEYAITLDSEVRLIWRRKITGASIIFFLNRYLLVLQNALTVASFWPISTSYNLPTQKPDNMPPPYNCSVDNALTVAQHTAYVRASHVRFPRSIRLLSVNIQLIHIAVVLLSRCTLIAGDAVVLGVTCWKTWSIKKAADAAHIGTSLVALLLRDGTMYFGAMLLLNVLHILINFIEKVSFLGDIAHVLTSVLVSRFIMNLRDVDGKDTGTDTVTTGGAGALETWHAERGTAGGGTLVFASNLNFVESMGGPLDRIDGGPEDDSQSDLGAQRQDEGSVESGEAKDVV
ncbi:hypothetical protein VTO73DRAFT_12051 [Trametes versicolor]